MISERYSEGVLYEMIKENNIKRYTTDDYSMFKHKAGNRTISEAAVRKVMNTIKKYGYKAEYAEIKVNSNFEILIGQHRFEACKRLGVPITYEIVADCDISTLQALEATQHKWSVMDYIESRAELGDVEFEKALKFIRRYSDWLTPSFVSQLIFPSTSKIIEGKINVTDAQYRQLENFLDWLLKFDPIFKHKSIKRNTWYFALRWCYESAEIDNDRLFDKMQKYSDKIMGVSNMEGALDCIEDIYNTHSHSQFMVYGLATKAKVGKRK